MKKTLFTALAAAMVAVGANAQSTQNIEFPSRVLKQTGKISAHTPDNYADESKTRKYPVIYTTDGEYNFETVVGLLGPLIRANAIPPCVIVGIEQ